MYMFSFCIIVLSMAFIMYMWLVHIIHKGNHLVHYYICVFFSQLLLRVLVPPEYVHL